jgi:hypothetical protein
MELTQEIGFLMRKHAAMVMQQSESLRHPTGQEVKPRAAALGGALNHSCWHMEARNI